jgi:hypothetical protein
VPTPIDQLRKETALARLSDQSVYTSKMFQENLPKFNFKVKPESPEFLKPQVTGLPSNDFTTRPQGCTGLVPFVAKFKPKGREPSPAAQLWTPATHDN